jgi:hypothetical protein
MDETKITNELPQHTHNQMKDLEVLFSSAPPDQLRQSLHEIYLTYIIQNHEMLPLNFTRIATNMYHLLDFLEKAEKK